MIACKMPKSQLLACLCFCLTLSQLAAITKCQSEQDLEDQFQDFHHDLGRISGGASRTASTPTQHSAPKQQHQQQQPLVRQPQAQANNEHDLQPVLQATTRRAPIATRVVHQQHQQQAAPLKPRNRVTLAVRQHASEAANVATPAQITQPIITPIQPVISIASQQQEQYAALMARVAAERQAHDQAVANTASREDFSVPAPAPQQIRSQQQQQQHSSHNLELDQSQVVAPPAAPPTFSTLLEPAQQAQHDHSQAASISAPAPASAVSAASISPSFGDQPEEQIEAPTFQQVLSNGCPRKGVFSWENKDHCDRYYMCTNGTFTEEACPNGLAYSQMGAVYQHCAYQWNVDCGLKKSPGPLASPGCPWQFGIFPTSANAQCSIDYFVCEWGVPEKKRCQPEGLFYDERIKGCQWADQLGCKSEALLNFKCPPEDEDNPFWPFPRYYHTKQDVIVCVNEQPRLVHCNEEQIVEPSSLSCIDLKKKKKKF